VKPARFRSIEEYMRWKAIAAFLAECNQRNRHKRELRAFSALLRIPTTLEVL